MIDLFKVERQLLKIGFKNKFFGKPEVRELCQILTPDEVIRHAVIGHYEGGFAILVATDLRVLLIDKKIWFLTMEDIRYDMIAEVDFCARLIDATISIVTFNKTLVFNSWRKQYLRELSKFVQQRVTEIRHIEASWNELQNTNMYEPVSLQTLPATNASNQQYLTQTPVNNFSNNLNSEESFLTSYQQAQVKMHSLAHLAGKLATQDFNRQKPLIRPLYPRPSLATHYKQGGLRN